MMTGQNIVCFANDWHSDPTSKHQVMKILARSNRVLWINSIGLRRPDVSLQDASRIVHKLRKFCQGPIEVQKNLHVLTPIAIPFHDLPYVPSVNAWLLSRYVRAQAKKLGMESFQMWTFLPTTAPLVRHLKADKVIYYCVDEWSAFSFLDEKLMRKLEESQIAQSDLVITSAEKLYLNKRHLNSHTYLLPHGVDSEFFSKARSKATEIPLELRNMRPPIIGFWGLIHEWIDLQLIRQIALHNPEWSVVLVGKIGVDCGPIRNMPNVHLLGPRQYESLPGFAKQFTAAILPFMVNRLTENVNPIKLREYLAAGLPVVSTALPEVRPYGEVVRIGETSEEFIKQLEIAVNDTSEESARRRVEAVATESWLARVEQLSDLISKIIPKAAL